MTTSPLAPVFAAARRGAACLSLVACMAAAAAAGDPAKGVIRFLDEVDATPGTRLVAPDGDADPVIVTDRRAGAPVLEVRTFPGIPVVTLSDNVRPGPPIESYAQIAAPRADRLAHLRKVATRNEVVKRAAEVRGGLLPDAGDTLRIVGRRDFMVMHGRRPGHEPAPGEPPQVYVSPTLLVSIPAAGGATLVYYTPAAGPGDPDDIAGELWQYKVPDDADDEDAEPRWVLTKPLTGSGSFHAMAQAIVVPEL